MLLHPTDQTFYHGMRAVCAAAIRKTGINLDDQSMDWGTVVQRRGKKEPLDQGGWSLFATSFPALDYLDPITAPALRGNGTAWYGWPVHEGIEKMREDWIAATDEGERKRLAAGIQKAALEAALYVPLGQYTPAAAWRKSLSGWPGPDVLERAQGLTHAAACGCKRAHASVRAATRVPQTAASGSLGGIHVRTPPPHPAARPWRCRRPARTAPPGPRAEPGARASR